LVLIAGSVSVSATCIAGIGNTCFSDSRETGIGRWFNINTPTEDSRFDVLNIGHTISTVTNAVKTVVNAVKSWTADAVILNKPSVPNSPKGVKGGSLTGTDDNGNRVISTYTDVSTVDVGAEDAWYYDLDIVKINSHQCIGCLENHPDTAGFDYEFEVSIRNTGNVANVDGFNVTMILENTINKDIWQNTAHMDAHDVGSSNLRLTLRDIGVNKTKGNLQIKEDYIFKGTGDSETIPMRLTVKLAGDDKETEAGFVEYEDSVRTCKVMSSGRTSCSVTKTIRKKVVHAVYEDPVEDDVKQYEFTLNKLTADILGLAGYNLDIRG